MRQPLLLVLLAACVACKAAPPPIQYGGQVTQQQDTLVRNSFQVAYEHCSGDKGPLALPVHTYDYKQKRWSPGTKRPEHCELKPGGLLQGFALTARLSAPNAPSFDVPQNADRMWSFALAADDQAMHDALVSLFGRDIVRGSEQAATGEVVRLYDGAAIQAIFKKVYQRPTDWRAGVLLQQLYDVVYRDTLRELAQDLVLIQAHPAQLAQLQNAFDTRVPTDKSFSVWSAAYELTKAVPELQAVPPSTLGMVVRRTHDGTLPVLRELLRQVLADYDPTFARTLGGQL